MADHINIIKIKPGVAFHPAMFTAPAMMHMVDTVTGCAPENYNPTITSGCEGIHKKDSKHYKGRALDFRIRDLSRETAEQWADRITGRLGFCYTVILKSNHIHIQYDGAKNGKTKTLRTKGILGNAGK